MNTYKGNEKTPISYKAYCQRTQGKLKGEEMWFVYIMSYLPTFPEYNPFKDGEVGHPKKEIRPEKAGELWESPKMKYFTWNNGIDGVRFFSQEGGEYELTDFPTNLGIIHKQNGWTRLYPPVEEGEKVVVEGVHFGKIQGENGAHYTSIISTSANAPRLEVIRDKPPMTMTLTWDKDKP